jgi:hypothetical protein
MDMGRRALERTKSAYKLALCGAPGAGKSTTSGLLIEELAACGIPSLVLKLAEPLYQVQRLIYTFVGRSLPEPYRQDGELLNFLGSYLRRLRSDFLTEDFAARVRTMTAEQPGTALICDDLRAPDVAAVTGLGFQTVLIAAPDEVRRARRRTRGDLSEGSESHATEVPIMIEPDHILPNDGDLALLRERVSVLLKEVRP